MSDKQEAKTREQGKTNHEMLMEICRSYKYFKDENGKPFAEVLDPHNKVSTIEIESSDFMNNIRGDYFKQTGKMPNSADLKSIAELTAYQVKTSHTTETMHFRFGCADGKNYIDMNNKHGEVIGIGKHHWSITQSSPIKFRRTPQQKSLCVPEKYQKASFKTILKYLRLTDKNQEMLVLATICSLVRTDIIRPILCFVGPPGSGKTTNAKIIRSLLDPREPLLNNTTNVAKDLALVFQQNALPLFDNQPPINRNMSDMLCTAVNGAGFENKKNYTDGELFHVSYKRGILMTALELPSTMPDFLNRCVHIALDRLTPKDRLSDNTFWENFELDKPKIFGGLLDTVQKAKLWEDKFTFSLQPRLVDFARFGASVCDVLGYNPNDFMKALFKNTETDKQGEMFESDPVASAIIEMINSKSEYEGTVSNLLIELNKYLGKFNRNLSPEILGKKLNKLIEYFKINSIEFDSKRTNAGTWVRLSKIYPSSVSDKIDSDIYVTKEAECSISGAEMEEANIFG